MHRSGTQHALLVGVVLAFCVLAAVACGVPEEEARPRLLPDGPRKLEPGAYRTEQFEPAFSFEVGGGWSTPQPEAYDLLVITRVDEGGAAGLREPQGGEVLRAHQDRHPARDGRPEGRGRLVPGSPLPGNPRD